MPSLIQRIPRGTLELLGIQGNPSPPVFEERVLGTLEMLQFYAGTQVTIVSGANAALAQNGNISIDVPGNQSWVLFQMAALVANTATMTGLELALGFGPTPAATTAVQTLEKNAGFAAGASIRIAWAAAYPRLLFPGSRLTFFLSRLGTDATANCFFSAQVGVLG